MKSRTLRVQFEELLTDACVELGYCLPLDFYEAIASARHYTADDFVDDIIFAEGGNPVLLRSSATSLKNLFVAKFGEKVNFCNGQFRQYRRKRLVQRKKKVEVILLEYAARNRQAKPAKKVVFLAAKFKGKHLLTKRNITS